MKAVKHDGRPLTSGSEIPSAAEVAAHELEELVRTIQQLQE